MDSLKTWLVEVALKKMGPAFVKGALASLFVYLGAHQGLLNSLGITWDSSGHVLQVDMDMLSAWALTIGSGAIMALFSAAQHHTVATVVGKPQDGDMRKSDTVPVEGGNRAEDKTA